jgi:hypothetical protein
METIKRQDITESKLHTFTTEASTLRWKPGYFPQQLKVEGQFGNGQPFTRTKITPDVIEYRQQLGCVTILVFND